MTVTVAGTNYGVTLKKATVLIGEIVSIDPPELMHEMVEATNHNSGGWREFVPAGLKQLDEFGCTVNFTTVATVSGMTTDLIAGTSASYAIGFPEGSTWTFNAYVTSFQPQTADATNPEALKADVKFRPTGTATLS